MAGAVEVRLELRAFFADHSSFGEAEYLKPAAIREDRSRPANEPVEAPTARDQLVAWPEKQVIGVAKDDFRAGILEIPMQSRFHGALRPDGHERRRLDDAVRGLKLAAAR